MEHDTFWTLIKDPAHWEFELFLIFIFDVVIGLLIWPHLKKWFRHHEQDDNKLEELEKRIEKLETNQ